MVKRRPEEDNRKRPSRCAGRGRLEVPISLRRGNALAPHAGHEPPFAGVAFVAFLPVVADHDDFRFMLCCFLFGGKALFCIRLLFSVRGGVLYVYVVDCAGSSGQYAVAVAFVFYLSC